jgi:hypothetical protein
MGVFAVTDVPQPDSPVTAGGGQGVPARVERHVDHGAV